MADHSHILFHKTPEQLRGVGARGGKACARNQRLRRAALAAVPALTPSPASLCRESTAQAVACLDGQFPWLQGAERRRVHPLRNRQPGAKRWK